MTTRRQLLALGAVAGTAGCLGQVLDDPIVVRAEPAGIDPDVLDEAGYEHVQNDSLELEESVSALGIERRVQATNWYADFSRTIDVAGFDLPISSEVEAGTVALLSTPGVSVLGRSFNPVATMSARELAELVQSEYDGIDSLEQLDEESATILDESTTVTRFEGRAEFVAEGVELDIILHLSEPVPAGDDLVVALGGYPSLVEDDEADRVRSMFNGVYHPA